MAYEERFMRMAMQQAKRAAALDEPPIGAVIVKEGQVIARGYNKRELKQDSLCHAEILAIHKACKKLGAWRLLGCDLYVTLEPCPMCAGAIIQARIQNVYFGAYDYKNGCAGSTTDLFIPGMFNHDVAVEGGKLEQECAALLSGFFKHLRKKK